MARQDARKSPPRRPSSLNVNLAPRSIAAFTRAVNLAEGHWVNPDAGAPFPLPLERLEIIGLDPSKLEEIIEGIEVAGGDEAILPPMLWVFDEDAWTYLTDPLVLAVLRNYCPEPPGQDWRHKLHRVARSAADPNWRDIVEDLLDAGVLPERVQGQQQPPILWADVTHRLWTGLTWKSHPDAGPSG